jgi:hypothetical protein
LFYWIIIPILYVSHPLLWRVASHSISPDSTKMSGTPLTFLWAP